MRPSQIYFAAYIGAIDCDSNRATYDKSVACYKFSSFGAVRPHDFTNNNSCTVFKYYLESV